MHYPHSSRLQTPADFQKVWKTGKRMSITGLGIATCENTLGHARLGVSISKKQISRAVDRNRLKRLARETFRLRQTQLGSRDVVVVAYKGIEAVSPHEQFQRFHLLWDTYLKRFGGA